MSCRNWTKLKKWQRVLCYIFVFPAYLPLVLVGYACQFIAESVSDGYFLRDRGH